MEVRKLKIVYQREKKKEDYFSTLSDRTLWMCLWVWKAGQYFRRTYLLKNSAL